MPSKRVLLTGANTLIGSHILEQLLSFNVSVRAVVGSREEAEVLQRQYPHRGPNLLEIAVVGNRDLLAPGAYDDVLDGDSDPFDTVIHTITADPYDEADCLSRFINLKTEALINFAKSIKDVAKNVQRVVITTSLTPFARWLVDPQMEERSARRSSVVSTSYQNAPEIDSDYVLATSQASDNIVYDALWKWTKDVRAPFSLVAVTAPSVYGPSIRPLENSSNLEEANRRIWNICGNDANERLTSPPYGVDFFTDVRDLAFASVQAMFMPRAANKRFTISAGMMPSGSVVADFLVGQLPELGGRVRAVGSPPRRGPTGDSSLEFPDTRPAATILGLVQYRMVEETLTDVARQILELQRQKDWKRVIQS